MKRTDTDVRIGKVEKMRALARLLSVHFASAPQVFIAIVLSRGEQKKKRKEVKAGKRDVVPRSAVRGTTTASAPLRSFRDLVPVAPANS